MDGYNARVQIVKSNPRENDTSKKSGYLFHYEEKYEEMHVIKKMINMILMVPSMVTEPGSNVLVHRYINCHV